MTPEQQRIAIAEACGWTRGHTCETQWVNDPHGIRMGWSVLRDVADSALPDYLNDLNAIYEAEKILSNSQIWQMDSVLFNMADCVAPFRATASQRAEAFLRTLNLWTP